MDLDHRLPGATLGAGDKRLPLLGCEASAQKDSDRDWVRLLRQAEARYVPVPDPCVFLG